MLKFIIRGLLLLSLLISSGLASAQCAKLAGRWGATITAAAADADLLYLATYDSGFHHLVVARSLPGESFEFIAETVAPIGYYRSAAVKLVVDNSRVFAVSAGGLAIFDVSDPVQPQAIGFWSFRLEDVRSVAITGSHALIANGEFGLHIVDFSDPLAPVEVARLGTSGEVLDVAGAGQLAFVADSGSGLRILDLSNPAQPTLVSLINLQWSNGYSTAASLVVAENIVIATSLAETHIIDISQPESPVIVATVSGGRYSRLIGEHLVVTGSYLRVYDLSDPQRPQFRAMLFLDHWAPQLLTAVGPEVLLRSREGITFVTIENPRSPVQNSFVPSIARAGQMVMDRNIAYLAYSELGFLAIDMTEPTRPTLLGSLDWAGATWESGLTISGNLALLADDATGDLKFIDISNPRAMELVGNWSGHSDYYDVEADSGTAFLLGTDGLYVIDLSDPSDAQQIAFWEQTSCFDGALIQDTLLLACDRGLVSLDISDPASPEEVGTLNQPSYSLAVEGHLAVLGARDQLLVVDVSRPENPQLLASTRVLGAIHEVALSQGRAYAVAGDFLSHKNLRVFDVSDPQLPKEIGSVPHLAGSESIPADIGFASQYVVAAVGDGGLVIADPSYCDHEPPPTDFMWSPTYLRAGEQADFQDLSGSDPLTRLWDFGDGSTSTEANPVHIYSQPGVYPVWLRTSHDRGQSSTTRLVVVHPRETDGPLISETGPEIQLIPGIAHANGLPGTVWTSDLVLHNPNSQMVLADLFFLEKNQDNSETRGRQVELNAGESLLLQDVVGDTFWESSAVGAVLVGSQAPLQVSARTFNSSGLQSDGSFGQFIAGADVDSLAAITGERYLLFLSEDGSTRTNVGLVSADGNHVSAEVNVVFSDGAPLGTHWVYAQPYSNDQVTSMLDRLSDDPVSNAWARVEGDRPGAPWMVYSSVVDNQTNSPDYFPAAGATSEPVYFLGIAHLDGHNGSHWLSDVHIANPGDEPVEIEMTLFLEGNNNPAPVVGSIPAGSALFFSDVMQSVFDRAGSGSLKVTPVDGEIVGAARTYNQTDRGRYGQGQQSIQDFIVGDQPARVIGLASSPISSAGFRTNLGFFAETDSAITIELYRGSGQQLGTIDLELSGGSYHQIEKVFRQVTNSAVAAGYALIYSGQPGGSFLCYASIVDNVSGDPMYQPCRISPSEP